MPKFGMTLSLKWVLHSLTNKVLTTVVCVLSTFLFLSINMLQPKKQCMDFDYILSDMVFVLMCYSHKGCEVKASML
jgi:hypothetical protein